MDEHSQTSRTEILNHFVLMYPLHHMSELCSPLSWLIRKVHSKKFSYRNENDALAYTFTSIIFFKLSTKMKRLVSFNVQQKELFYTF